jgi:FtsZ-binding cell division protein ZapB
MGALSWVRLLRRVPGAVRQQEFANLEAMIEAEAGRQPTRNLFVLSCAIPAGVATFGGASVFVAWLAGNTGLPLALGAGATAVLTASTWYAFFRLYRAVPASTRHLRDLIFRFSRQYGSFGNIVLGEQRISGGFAALLDEAAGIYSWHGFGTAPASEAEAKVRQAIETAMTKLLEVALQKDQDAQNQALSWAQPLVDELRRVDRSLQERVLVSRRENRLDDPLAELRAARIELETDNEAVRELDQHLQA